MTEIKNAMEELSVGSLGIIKLYKTSEQLIISAHETI